MSSFIRGDHYRDRKGSAQGIGKDVRYIPRYDQTLYPTAYPTFAMVNPVCNPDGRGTYIWTFLLAGIVASALKGGRQTGKPAENQL